MDYVRVDYEAMYFAQCKCTDEWADKYEAEVERKADATLLSRITELEQALATVNSRLAQAQGKFAALESEKDALVERVKELREEEKKFRHLLFMAHGNAEHYLYGDDGERQCNACMIDFNADAASEIERKLWEYNMRKIARLQAEGKDPFAVINAALAKGQP